MQRLGAVSGKIRLAAAGLTNRGASQPGRSRFALRHGRDGVQYAEIRFAPLLHTTQGLRCEEVVESVLAGIRSAQSEGCATKAQLILCAMRHHTPQQNEVVLQTALTFRGSGVCAIDLAGDEAAYPLYAHAALFRAAHKENLPFTIHAGECGQRGQCTLRRQAGRRAPRPRNCPDAGCGPNEGSGAPGYWR